MTKQQFLAWPHKAITLIGMSGIGKTMLANRLPKSDWFHYSGDYRIGTKYLEEPILDNIKQKAMQVDFLRDLLRSDSIYICSNITVHNLVPISTFLGKIGNEERGGLSVDEFKRRQRLHRDAEIAAMHDVEDFITKAREIYGYSHFINDAGGSVCELDHPATMEHLARHSVIVYLQADQGMEEDLIERAVHNPKPLYYQDKFLDNILPRYLTETQLESHDDIDPDQFVQWVFPHLVAHRRPLYEAIARDYGYTLDARKALNIDNEDGILELIASTLDTSS